MKDRSKEELRITINKNKLPIHIVFEGTEGKKEYVLKSNGKFTKLMLNKK